MSLWKEIIISDEYNFRAENTPTGDLRVAEPYRLVGTSFDGSTIDSNFWTTAASGTAAAIAQANAKIVLTTGTGSGAAVTMYSVRRARYVGGNALRYRAVVQLADAGTTNNKRRWGVGYGSSMPTITDGAWFQLDGTEFSINTKRAGAADVKVTSFNGALGASYTPGTSAATYEIYWTNKNVWFSVNGTLLHTISASADTWAGTMNMHAFADSLNAAAASSTTMDIRVATICRLGRDITNPIYKNISGNAATWVLKYGPGVLHKIIFNNTSGTSFQIIDNFTGTTPVIGTITTTTVALGSWLYDLPFNTGLTIITTGNGLDLTVVYE